MVDQTGFVLTKTTGNRQICTVHGAKHLLEGMKDRRNLFHSFSDSNWGKLIILGFAQYGIMYQETHNEKIIGGRNE
jgi:hypothetical protein